jgi:hypothetical protein
MTITNHGHNFKKNKEITQATKRIVYVTDKMAYTYILRGRWCDNIRMRMAQRTIN